MIRILLLPALLLVLTFAGPAERQNPTLKVQLEGLKTGKGELLLALYNSEKGFPDNPKLAFRTWALPPSKELQLNDVPPGNYALVLLHDLDQNKKMSFSFLGFPKEGYASSPDGGGRFSKPEFRNSMFTHSEKGTRLSLRMHYW